MTIEEKLKNRGLTLPEPAAPIASYVPYVRTGNLLFLSGQLPFRDGQVTAVGTVPSQVSIVEAHAAARVCAINALAAVKAAVAGDWSKVRRVVRVGLFVRSDAGFTEQAKVANGASDLLVDLLGDAGRHVRTTVGVNTLPLGATVELEMVVEVGD